MHFCGQPVSLLSLLKPHFPILMTRATKRAIQDPEMVKKFNID